MKKKLFAMALCLLMVVAMAVPAFAETFRATPPYFQHRLITTVLILRKR